MTIAVLDDVHANLAALEAVLGEPDVAAADTVVFGGDLVPGPQPAETMELVRSLGRRARMIRGNGEREVCAADLGGARDAVPEETCEAWVRRRLDIRDLAKLRDLPLVIQLEGAILCHATPTSDSASVTMVMPDADLVAAMAPVSSGLLVVGHTHRQFDRRVGDLRVVNPGSVGIPYDGSPEARWALIDGPQVYLRATPYDVDLAISACEEVGFPDSKHLESLRAAAAFGGD